MADIGGGRVSANLADSLSYMASVALISSRSDALEKLSSWMGLQLAVQSQGVSRNASNDQSFGLVRALVPGRSANSPFGDSIINDVHIFERKLFLETKPLLATIGTYERYTDRISVTQSASTDSSAKPKTVPLIIPGLGWQSNEHTLSLGLNIQAMLVSVVIPAIISTSGQAQWQILRDVYADFSPQLQFYPITLFTGQFISMSSLPLSLVWSHSGYMNTDIAYNSSDMTFLQCSLIPSFFPIGQTISASDGRDSTAYHNGSSTTFEVQCGRGFPITRYSSLVVGAMASEAWYSERVQDPMDTLYRESDVYTTTGLSARYCFPLARQINRGRRYADALYGSLVYKTQLYSNAAVTSRTIGDALSRQSYNSWHYLVEHDIGATLTLGCTKHYSFSQMNSLSVFWSIWAKRLLVNFSAGI